VKSKAIFVIGAGLLGLLAGCGTQDSNDAPAPQQTSQSFESSDPGNLESTPSTKQDSGQAFNTAWSDLVTAQDEYAAIGTDTDADQQQTTDNWTREVEDKLDRMRRAWLRMKVEAAALDLPTTFQTKGVISRGTMDEYLDAYEGYLAMQETFLSDTKECIARIDDLSLCVTISSAEQSTNEEAQSAYERLWQATLNIFEEANQPPQ